MGDSRWPEIKEKLTQVTGWAREGCTNEMIFNNLGISQDTFYQYKKKHKEFADAVKIGKEVIDFMVENALLKSALGFKYTEEAVTNKGDIVTIEKNQAPSNTAQIFWLKNRKPAVWRDKRQVELNSRSEMTEDEINERLKELGYEKEGEDNGL
jgi:hypothetical protein